MLSHYTRKRPLFEDSKGPIEPSRWGPGISFPLTPPPLPSPRFIPGQWPIECGDEQDEASLPSSGASASTFFTTVGRWAATVTNITTLFNLPQRLARRFLRPQRIEVVPIVRNDGSNKKRFIAAGVADEPAPLSPSERARGNMARQRARRLAGGQTFPKYLRPRPSPGQAQNSGSLGQLNENPTLAHLLRTDAGFAQVYQSPSPARLDHKIHNSGHAQLFKSPQANTLVTDGAGNDDDSLDWSWSDVLTSTPPQKVYDTRVNPSPRGLSHDLSPHGPFLGASLNGFSPDGPSLGSSPVKHLSPIKHSSPVKPPSAVKLFSGMQPAVKPPTAPKQYFTAEQLKELYLPKNPAPAPKVDPYHGFDSIHGYPAITPMRRHLLKRQMITHFGPLEDEDDSMTDPELVPASPTKAGDDELPDASSSPFDEDLPSSPPSNVSSSPFDRDVSSSPFQADISSSPFQADVSSPFQADVVSPCPTKVSPLGYKHYNLHEASSSPFDRDVPAFENTSPCPARVSTLEFEVPKDTYEDLSDSNELPQYPSVQKPNDNVYVDDFVYENDMSHLEDAPYVERKSVHWTSHADAKSFYVDQRVVDMHDASLQSIRSSPVKAYQNVNDAPPESSDNEDPNAASQPDSPTATTSNDQAGSPIVDPNDQATSPSDVDPNDEASAPTIGYRGVPQDIWDSSDDSDQSDDVDESLSELEMSAELLDSLKKEWNEKLVIAPPPAPAPAPVPTPAPARVSQLVNPLSQVERDLLEATAKRTDNGKHVDMEIVPNKINAHDFGTLLPKMFNGSDLAWLNDNIVNEYLTILTKHKQAEAGYVKDGTPPPVHAFSSFWFVMATSNTARICKWAERACLEGRKYLEAGLVLYPICRANHWRLLAVKPKERTIEYFDSLGGAGAPIIESFKKAMAIQLGEDWVPEEWTVQCGQRSTAQINGQDCGVFTVLNALTLLRDDDPKRVIANDGMAEARDRIAATLLAGKPTDEF